MGDLVDAMTRINRHQSIHTHYTTAGWPKPRENGEGDLLYTHMYLLPASRISYLLPLPSNLTATPSNTTRVTNVSPFLAC